MKRIEGDSCKLAVDVVCDRILRQLDDASGVLTVPVTTGGGGRTRNHCNHLAHQLASLKKGKIPVAC